MKMISYSNSYYYLSEQLYISIASENRLYRLPPNLGTWIDSDFLISIIFHFICPFIKVLWAQPFILLQSNIL